MGQEATPGAIRWGVKEAMPREEGLIRIATYNIENLFDDQDDPGLSGRVEDAEMTKPGDHCKAAAEAIRAIDADVLALQEIESKDALLWFRDAYLDGMGYDHVVSRDAGDGRGIENAVLSRFPLSNAQVWPGKPLDGEHPEMLRGRVNQYAGEELAIRRSPLRVDVTVPARGSGENAYTFTMLVVHKKSGRDYEYWRAAEARSNVEFVGQMESSDPDANIVVLGDFNSQPFYEPVTTYIDAGMHDVFGDRIRGDATAATHASGRSIDLILVNDAMLQEVRRDRKFILGTVDREEGYDWRSTPTPEGWASDHYPVVVDLEPVDATSDEMKKE